MVLPCIFFLITSFLGAATFEMKTDIAACLHTKQLTLSCICDDSEQGIMHNTLCFSIDQPQIIFKRWRADHQPKAVWNELLKKKNLLYPSLSTFSVSLVCDQSPEKFQVLLEAATFSVSCVIMGNDGTLRPHTQVMEMRDGECMHESRIPVRDDMGVVKGYGEYDKGVEQHSSLPSLAQTRNPCIQPIIDPFMQSITHVWNTFKTIFWSVITLAHVLWCLLIVCLLLVCSWLRRRLRIMRRFFPSLGLWERELFACAIFLAGCCVIELSTMLGARVVTFAALSVWCLVGMGYVLATPPDRDLFLGRLKKLIGFCLGTAVLPLAVKAMLAYYGF